MADDVQIAPMGTARRITLSRPPANLLDPPFLVALREAMLDADADPDVRAIVLTGAGEAFCGGLDTAQIRAGANPVDFAGALVDLYRIFPRLEKPVVTAVNGDALAAGYGIACASDVTIAVDSANLGTVETTRGIWPMIAQVPPLQRLAPRHALENILTGEPFSAERALAVGVVNEVVSSGALDGAVTRWVAAITRSDAAVIASGRQAFHDFIDMTYDDALSASLDRFRRMFEEA